MLSISTSQHCCCLLLFATLSQQWTAHSLLLLLLPLNAVLSTLILAVVAKNAALPLLLLLPFLLHFLALFMALCRDRFFNIFQQLFAANLLMPNSVWICVCVSVSVTFVVTADYAVGSLVADCSALRQLICCRIQLLPARVSSPHPPSLCSLSPLSLPSQRVLRQLGCKICTSLGLIAHPTTLTHSVVHSDTGHHPRRG